MEALSKIPNQLIQCAGFGLSDLHSCLGKGISRPLSLRVIPGYDNVGHYAYASSNRATTWGFSHGQVVIEIGCDLLLGELHLLQVDIHQG